MQWVRRLLIAGGVAVTVTVTAAAVAGAFGIAPASAVTSVESYPPIGRVVIAHPLPQFRPDHAGPNNGPLAERSFAAQAPDLARANAQFRQLAREPGFAAYLRVWTDSRAQSEGANDVVISLYLIPDLSLASAFAADTRAPLRSTHTATFRVPLIPRARGFTLEVSSPIHAIEQFVVFRVNGYVAIIQLASAQAGNQASLSSADAVRVADEQYGAIRKATRADALPLASKGGTGIGGAMLVAVLCGVALVSSVLGFREYQRRQARRTGLDPGGSPLPGPVPVLPGPAPVPVPDHGVRIGESRTVELRSDRPVGDAPGWLPDPWGPTASLRYWDGRIWTIHVATPVGSEEPETAGHT